MTLATDMTMGSDLGRRGQGRPNWNTPTKIPNHVGRCIYKVLAAQFAWPKPMPELCQHTNTNNKACGRVGGTRLSRRCVLATAWGSVGC